MDWSELNKKSKVKLECSQNGFYDITSECSDLNTAVEKVLAELYYNYNGKSLIRIEINRTLIFLDRYNHPHTSYFDIWGRKYRTGKDTLFLNRVVSLGKIATNLWEEDFQTFFSLMSPLLKCWIEMVQKDKELTPNYQW